MNVRKNLQTYLKANGLSAASLARRAMVPRATLSSWLAGTTPSNIQHLKAVADATGHTLDELIFGDLSGDRGRHDDRDQHEGMVPGLLIPGKDGTYVGLFEVRLRPVKRQS